MSGANYWWNFQEVGVGGQKFYILFIEDRDLGGISVTNDIENVLARIKRDYDGPLDFGQLPIMYRDSDGRWDEIVVDEEGFFLSFSPLQKMEHSYQEFYGLLTRLLERHNARRPG